MFNLSFKMYAEDAEEAKMQEDEEGKLRIEQLRNLHRNVFMRHVHIELGKI